jgi:hypothetical protein
MLILRNGSLKIRKSLFKRRRFKALLQSYQYLGEFVSVTCGDVAAFGSSVKSRQFDADILKAS